MQELPHVSDEASFLASNSPLPVFFDGVFRRLFDDTQHCFLLISFLNALLHRSGTEAITSLTLQHRDLSDLRFVDKENIFDIRATDGAGRRLNIEMQVAAQSFYRSRSVFYLSRLHASQLERGEPYTQLNQTIGIHLVCFNLFSPLLHPHVHSLFELREREHHHLYSDQLQLHLLELEKLPWDPRHPPDLTTLDKGVAWLYFVRYGHLLSLPPELSMLPPEFLQARQRLDMISEKQDLRWAYICWEKHQRDAAVRYIDARAEGKIEGHAEGKIEGRAEGKIEGIAEGLAEGKQKALQLLQGLLNSGVLTPELFEAQRRTLMES
ncbi:MAG: Rpn family recombination-promoting nuclease/putative transposase [Myxococcota bacterium]